MNLNFKKENQKVTRVVQPKNDNTQVLITTSLGPNLIIPATLKVNKGHLKYVTRPRGEAAIAPRMRSLRCCPRLECDGAAATAGVKRRGTIPRSLPLPMALSSAEQD